MGGILFVGLGGGVGGSGSSLAIPDKHVFTGSNKAQAESARDSYFTQNPTEKVKDVYALVKPTDGTGPFLQTWDGAAWIDETKVIQGSKGLSGSTPVIGANGNWFIDGNDTGIKASGLDTSAFKNGEIPIVDSATGKFVSSKVFAEDGTLVVEPGSLTIGAHKWSSSAENTTVQNLVSEKYYSPVWQEIAPGLKDAFIREHKDISDITRSSDAGDDVVNPSFEATVTDNETAFSVTVNLSSPVTNLVMTVLLGSKRLFMSKWKSVASGVQKLNLESPSDYKAGVTYTIAFTSEDGDVTMKGSDSGVPYYISHVSLWGETQVATREWAHSLPNSNLSNPVTHVSLIGSDKLQMTHADGTKNVLALLSQGGGSVDLTPLKDDITMLERSLTNQGNDITALKQQYGNLEHSLNDLHSTYVYTGPDLPYYPSDPQGRYFITLKGQAARNIDLDMPDHNSADMKDGTMYFLENDNSQAVVNLSTPMGQTIGGSQTLTIQPNHHILLFKKGTDWVVAMNKSNGSAAIQVSSADVAAAIDNGEFTGNGSLKGLASGWWVAKVSNAGITGRPNDSQGDLVIFKQGVSGSTAKPGYAVMMVFGKDTNSKASAWAQYRDGNTWTPWFKVSDVAGSSGAPVDLSAINQAITSLQTRVTSITGDVSDLKTSVGNIYAPSKTVFDAEVNALINARIAELIPSGGGGVTPLQHPKIYAMFSNSIPNSLSGEGVVTSTNGKASLTRIQTNPSRVFVLVENDKGEAVNVQGISVDGGLSANWQPRDVVIGSKKYKAFYSSGAYIEQSLKITVDFG